MNLSPEARTKIADIVYQLNVEPDEVDAVVDEIAKALQGEDLIKRCTNLRSALEPFANCVFNDNGDVTVEATASRENYIKAYFAHKG